MRNILFATVALLGMISASAVMADEFNGGNAAQDQQQQQAIGAYMDQQATNSQLSDPTAPNSIRSHGHP